LAVNLVPSDHEIMIKSCVGSSDHALTILCISNRRQSMADSELLLDKYIVGKGFIQ